MVNYPHPHHLIRKKTAGQSDKKVNFANRGMSFEAAINATNSYYLAHSIAVIHKKPTPIQIVKVDYPMRSRAKIVEAYFRQPSTTDYSGVYRGHYIDFEAKETRLKTAMPMKNFHMHQIEHMAKVLEQQGICFVLLHFSSLKETYFLPAKALIDFYQIDHGTKSMPLDYIKKKGYWVEMKALPQVPYLDIIENYFLGGDYYQNDSVQKKK
ncbi:Holliday junction resolvase RecU [Streptococcus sp. H49]|uniref:Holliday junction resolvase RecU n=1 Tax=Streptococcus huangxiaojuni TaxID=3237239 RepID=UPI0034A2C1F6